MVQAVKKIVKTEVKEAFVEDLKKQITEGGTLVMVTYQGLTVEESSDLRDKLRAVGGSFRVVKNTMLRRAVAGTSLEGLQEHCFGSTAIMISGAEDPVTSVKELVTFAKTHEVIQVKAGGLEGRVMSEAEVIALSKLPSKEELLAKMLGSINAPASNLVGALSGVARNLVYALKAIHDQKAAA